ncbi:MAG: ATP-binding cassette domain-containing protein [Lewinella sp.]|nr:ATP-binding cassette domain-containing protein [Lewinella sp.]
MQLSVTESIQRRVFARSSFEFAWRLPRINYEELLGNYPPELVNRFFDTLTLQKGLPKLLTDVSTGCATNRVWPFAYLALSSELFAFSAVLLAVLIGLFFLTGPQGLNTSLMESKYKYLVAHWLEEIGRAVTTFKLSGQSKFPTRKTKYLLGSYLKYRHAHFRILLVQYGAMVAFQTMATLALLAIGSSLVINNDITLGQFVAAEIVFILILSSVEKLILSVDTIYDMLTAVEKIGFVSDMSLEDCENDIAYQQIDSGQGLNVQLRNVSFNFPDSPRCVIDDVSLEIKAGERICILGPQRSGKATLIQLLGMLYTSYQGSISYNGVPARNLNYQELRQHIGDYMRDEDIFSAPLLDNLWLLDCEADMQQVQAVVDQLGLTDFVSQLPNGYQTDLLPAGRNLPASIRTKLLLARTMMGKPRLLALGDFGASLGAADRRRVAQVLTSFDKEAPLTVVAVSDDAYFASRCDRLLFLEDGKILLDGSFQELQNDPRVAYVLGLSSYNPYINDPNQDDA